MKSYHIDPSGSGNKITARSMSVPDPGHCIFSRPLKRNSVRRFHSAPLASYSHLEKPSAETTDYFRYADSSRSAKL